MRKTTVGAPHITVCICTFRRAAFLRRLLEKLKEQKTGDFFTFSVAVCDNDVDQSAAPVVSSLRRNTELEITYVCEARQNIALARNKVLEAVRGDFVAFIDDDEFPAQDWLLNLSNAYLTHQASGVLGPVRPHFDAPPPPWILRGKFCERPEYPTGRIMRWEESRTGNLLFHRSILNGTEAPFDPNFGTGGEDMDFFRRMNADGRVFIWCAEAVAYEIVPVTRLSRAYMLKRALLRGKNIVKHPTGRWQRIAISFAAFPLYLLLLPLTAIGGHHCFMRYCIKLCDHAGRLLGLLGLNPVTVRDL